MDLRKYQALIKITELGNMTQAAQELGYSQPGISRMITALENEMGFPLLIRKKSGAFPTKDALELLPFMQQIVGEEETLQKLAKQVAALEGVNLHIGCSHSTLMTWIPAVLQRYLHLHPKTQIHLYDQPDAELSQLLSEHRIDIALTSLPLSEKFEFYPLYSDYTCVLLPKHHALSGQSSISLEQLAGEPFLIPTQETDDDIFAVLQELPEITPRIWCHGQTNREGIITMVAKDLGISLIPHLLVDILPDSVTAVKLNRNFCRKIGIAVQSREFSSPAAKEFMNLLEDMLPHSTESDVTHSDAP